MNRSPYVAIVDCGLGNLFSVKHACQHVGIEAIITSSFDTILSADGVILPGVGAFGDAMGELKKRDLIAPLLDFAAQKKPLIGICLGMQLLMSESEEFGHHRGLNLIEGSVVRFGQSKKTPRYKVPQVGWNRIDGPWSTPLLSAVPEGSYMYFVHSYYVQPCESEVIVSHTIYGDTKFCSSLQKGNIFASQFHPERSGKNGLKIYQNIALLIQGRQGEQP